MANPNKTFSFRRIAILCLSTCIVLSCISAFAINPHIIHFGPFKLPKIKKGVLWKKKWFKQGTVDVPIVIPPGPPKPNDFGTGAEYAAALRKYNQWLGNLREEANAAKANGANWENPWVTAQRNINDARRQVADKIRNWDGVGQKPVHPEVARAIAGKKAAQAARNVRDMAVVNKVFNKTFAQAFYDQMGTPIGRDANGKMVFAADNNIEWLMLSGLLKSKSGGMAGSAKGSNFRRIDKSIGHQLEASNYTHIDDEIRDLESLDAFRRDGTGEREVGCGDIIVKYGTDGIHDLFPIYIPHAGIGPEHEPTQKPGVNGHNHVGGGGTFPWWKFLPKIIIKITFNFFGHDLEKVCIGGDAPDSLPTVGEQVQIQMLGGEPPEALQWGEHIGYGDGRWMNYLSKVHLSSDLRFARVFFPSQRGMVTFEREGTTWTYKPAKNERLVSVLTVLTFSDIDTNGTPTKCSMTFPDNWSWDFSVESSATTSGVLDGSVYRIISRKTPLGHAITFAYNANDVTLTDASGNQYVCAFDSNKRITNITIKPITGAQRVWTYTYDGLKLTETNEQTGKQVITEMSSDYKAIYEGWRDNNTAKTYSRVYEYDTEGNLTKVNINGQEKLISDVRNQDGTLARTQTIGNTVRTYAQNEGGLSGITNAFGQQYAIQRNSMFQVTSETDQAGNAIINEYDAAGNLTRQVAKDGAQTLYEYDGSGNLTRKQTPAGVWTYEYAGPGLLTKETSPDGAVWQYVLDTRGLRTRVIDPLGNIVDYEYDSRGLMTSKIGPYQGTPPSPRLFEYDDFGNMTKRTDELGNITLYEYDSANRLTAVTDPLGNTTRAEYNSFGQKIKQTDPSGAYTTWEWNAEGKISRISGSDSPADGYNNVGRARGITAQYGDYEYSPSGDLTKYTDLNGNVTQYEYDAAGRMTKKIDAQNNETIYAYDTRDNLISLTDANGNITTYTYDAAGRRISKIDPLGNATTYTYDLSGHLIKIGKPSGAFVSFIYDSMGRVIQRVDEIGRITSYEYDLLGRTTKIIDPKGIVTTYVFDANGNTTQVIRDANGLQVTTTAFYDAVGRLTRCINPLGQERTYSYDNAGRPVSETTPMGYVFQYEYDSNGRMTRMQTPGGEQSLVTYGASGKILRISDGVRSTVYTYDAMGRKISESATGEETVTYTYDSLDRIIREDKSGSGITLTRSFVYDGAGNQLQETDAEGHTWHYAYDAGNRRISMTDPLGNVRTYAYDAEGRLLTETDPCGNVVSFEYDAAGQKTSATNGAGSKTTFTYDGMGYKILESYANGSSKSWQYDALGRVVAVTDELGNNTSMLYDAAGHLTRLVDQGGMATDYEYDADGRMTKRITDAGGVNAVTLFELDADGRVLKQTDPLGRQTTYSYNGLGWRLTKTSPTGLVTSYEYDSAGRLTRQTDPSGRYQAWTYDAFSRETSKTNGVLTTTTSYDRNGKVTSVGMTGSASFQYFYDAGRRLTREVQTDGATTITKTYVVDPAGRQISTTDANGNTTTHTYDGASHLLTATDPLGNLTGYEYDPCGRVTKILYANGTTTTYTYDAKGQSLSVANGKGEATFYEYDGLGRKTKETDAMGASRFWAYDHLGRLVSTTDKLGNVTQYEYDLAGQLTRTIDPAGVVTVMTYDLEGRMVSKTRDPSGLSVTTTYQYDAAGNVTREIDSLGNEATYTYDAAGRMALKTTPLGYTTSYEYSPSGARTKVTDAAGHVSTMTLDAFGRVSSTADEVCSVAYEYDLNGNVTQKSISGRVPIAYEYDALNRLTRTIQVDNGVTYEMTRTYGPGSNILTQTDGEGNTTTYTYDMANRRTAVANALGQVTQYTYDANGRLVAQTDPNGNTVSTEYDALGRVTRRTNGKGESTSFTYDSVGNLVSTTDPTGATTQRFYDALRRLTKVTDALNNDTLFQVDSLGRVIQKVDAAGVITAMEYDADGRRTKVTADAGGIAAVTQYAYDPMGRVIRKTDPLGHQTTYTYNPVGKRLSKTTPLGLTTLYEYDALGIRTRIVDAAGNARTKTLDGLGRVVSTSDGIATITYQYDRAGNVVQQTTTDRAPIQYFYDAANQMTRQVQTDGATTIEITRAYDDAGNVTGITDGEGHTTTYTYDAANRLQSKTDAMSLSTSFAYDAAGRITAVTDANGNVSSTEYDALGRITRQTNGANESTLYAYDVVGNLVQTTTPTGATTVMAYDPLRHITMLTDALGNSTQYVYDVAGRRIRVTNAKGVVTDIEYDMDGRRTRVVADAAGLAVATQYQYDGMGRVTALTDALGHVTTYAYDAVGRMTSTTDATNNVTTYTYDAMGVRTSKTDGSGRTETATVDGFGRVTSTNNGVTTIDYAFDLAGNVTRKTVSGRIPVSYEYDAAGRLTLTSRTDGTITIATSKTYDGVGNVLTTTDGEGKVTTYTYDAANRVVSTTNALGQATDYAYDADGRRTSISYANGTSLHYTYDAMGRLIHAVGGPSGEESYEYDELGQLTKTTDANSRSTIQTFDALGRMIQTTNQMGQTVVHTYDALGRRIRLVDANGNASLFAYDNAGRLTHTVYPTVDAQISEEIYTYDGAGRVVTKTTPNGNTITYSYDPAGAIASINHGATTTYTRDAAGAVISIAGPNTTMHYAYDGFGRMTSVTDSALGKTINYAYNKQNLRIQMSGDMGSTVDYAYDDAMRLTMVKRAGEANGCTYSYDAGGRRTKLVRENGVTTNYTYDSIDRLVSLTTENSASTVISSFQYAYDAAGNRTSLTMDNGDVIAYEFDDAYRLTRETRSSPTGNNYYQAFAYDAVGNRTQMQGEYVTAYQPDPDTGALWHFDAGDGAGLIPDATGRGNDAFPESEAAITDQGRFGRGVSLDGSDRLSVIDTPNLELGGTDFTLEAWIKVTTTTGDQGIMTKWDPAGNDSSFKLYLNNGQLTLLLSSDGSTVTTITGSPASPLNADTWYHVAATRNGDTVKLWVNGAEEAGYTLPANYTIHDSARNLLLGDGLTGSLDEARISGVDRSGTFSQVTITYTYNARNQLTRSESGIWHSEYEYDADGNQTQVAQFVNAATQVSVSTFAYDPLDRMTGNSTPAGSESFTYQGTSSRRHSITAKGVTTQFLHDGDDVAADFVGGTLTRSYLTPFMDENLSMTVHGATPATYYFSHDGLGSVRTLTDTTGAVVNRYDYMAFGKPHAPGTTVGIDQRYTFTGRERNPLSGTMYYRNRTYAPGIGRFISRDPAGYPNNPDGNLYVYASNNPGRFTDPFGLDDDDGGHDYNGGGGGDDGGDNYDLAWIDEMAESQVTMPATWQDENLNVQQPQETQHPMRPQKQTDVGGKIKDPEKKSAVEKPNTAEVPGEGSTATEEVKDVASKKYSIRIRLLFSGEETIIILRGLTKENALKILEEYRQLVEKKNKELASETEAENEALRREQEWLNPHRIAERLTSKEYWEEAKIGVSLLGVPTSLEELGTEAGLFIATMGMSKIAGYVNKARKIRRMQRALRSMRKARKYRLAKKFAQRLQKEKKSLKAIIDHDIDKFRSMKKSGKEIVPTTGSGGEVIARGPRSHLNGAIGEARGFQSALDAGDLPVKAPGKVTVPGPDFITVNPKTGQLTIWDAKYRSPGGSYPSSIPASKLQKWMPAVRQAVQDMPPGPAKSLAEQALESGNLAGEIFRWPQ